MNTVPPNFAPLTRTERRMERGARRVGTADPQEVFPVSIRIPQALGRSRALPDPQQTGPSTGSRTAMSRKDFANTYGADPADLETMPGSPTPTHCRSSIAASHAAQWWYPARWRQFNRIFGTNLGRYESPHGNYRGPRGIAAYSQRAATGLWRAFRFG